MAFAKKPDGCAGCPAYTWGQGFVPPQIPRRPHTPKIVFIGQGPGETEALYSIPFHPEAASGKSLTEWMHLSELQRTEVYITNSVQCWLPERFERGLPKGNRNPAREEQDFCYRAHLHPMLVANGLDTPDTWVFTVGAPASEFFLQVEKSEPLLGTVTVTDLPPMKESQDEQRVLGTALNFASEGEVVNVLLDL